MVTADSSSNAVGVYLATGNREFASRIAYATEKYPSHVLLADLSGDQELDLIAVNTYASSVSVRQGLGDGTFAAKVKCSLLGRLGSRSSA